MYTVNTTVTSWTLESNASFDSATFAANTCYAATVTLNPTSNYTFADGLGGTIRINGRNTTVVNNHGTSVELRHLFQRTEANQYWEGWTILPALAANATQADQTLSGNYRIRGNTTIANPSTAGLSGLIINGTVTIYIPAGVTLTLRGVNGSGAIGGGGGSSGGLGGTGSPSLASSGGIKLEGNNGFIP